MTADEKGTALITGAAKRIGRVLALDLAAQGWSIAVHYGSSREEADQLVHQIGADGGTAASFQADLSSADETLSLIDKCCDRFGPPACLINNASLFRDDSIASLTLESWTAHLDTNLRAPVLLAQAFASALPQDLDGNIINILDQRVWKLTPHFFSYSISKAALWTATQTLAQALAPRIRVNAIGPGPVLRSLYQSEQQFADQQKRTILGRGTTPEEIAATVNFILGAPALTGQMIALDSGQHLAWQTPDVLEVEN